MVSLSASGKLALDELLTKAIEEKKLPCITGGVSTVDDEEIYFKCAGFNSADGPSSGEINKDSVFWVCSQTKLVTHLAALQLIEKGKLQTDTPVSIYLPVFENPIVLDDVQAEKPSFRPATTAIRVHHLLNYTSGLYYSQIFDLPNGYTERHDEKDPVGHFYNVIKGDLPALPLKFEPGTEFAYGYSSDTLGFIIEKITGQTLEQYCQENIFKPLGMTSTSFYLTPELKSRAINLSITVNGKLENFANPNKVIEQDPSRVKLLFGGVGLYSSVKDYLTLLRHLLQIKVGKTLPNSIISTKTVQEIFTPALPPAGEVSFDLFGAIMALPPGNQWGTALALRTKDWPEGKKKGSAFWSGWAGTSGHIDPESGIVVFLGTQVAPSLDGAIFGVAAEFEKILYANLQ